MVLNIILIFVVLVIAFVSVKYFIKKNKEAEIEEDIPVEDKTYTIEATMDFVKRRLDEITKVNLYDIGLSEEELKRRKNKKYELKKALKGCTYGDVNDKKYVKELIFDLLSQEYGINENVVLSEGSCGKPYLSNYPFVHFNLSHCDKGVACMISDSAVGIDITSVKKENMSCM